jgi:hypothetical protein
MHQMSSTPVRVDFDVEPLSVGSALEWRAVTERRVNLLLEGPEPATDAALLLLRQHLRGIIDWKRGTAPLDVPYQMRTLLVENVDTLEAQEQANLLTWTGRTDGRVQIVSVTRNRLFPLVARGVFDERLYYRLNTIFLRLD